MKETELTAIAYRFHDASDINDFVFTCEEKYGKDIYVDFVDPFVPGMLKTVVCKWKS